MDPLPMIPNSTLPSPPQAPTSLQAVIDAARQRFSTPVAPTAPRTRFGNARANTVASFADRTGRAVAAAKARLASLLGGGLK